jgi:hypothetical protein
MPVTPTTREAEIRGMQFKARWSKKLARPHLNQSVGHAGTEACDSSHRRRLRKEDHSPRPALDKKTKPNLKITKARKGWWHDLNSRVCLASVRP